MLKTYKEAVTGSRAVRGGPRPYAHSASATTRRSKDVRVNLNDRWQTLRSFLRSVSAGGDPVTSSEYSANVKVAVVQAGSVPFDTTACVEKVFD